MTARKYFPHWHQDDLGTVQREGQVAVCPGCGKVVKGAVAYGHGWWRTMLWPWSRWWRRRLTLGERDA